MSEFVKLACDFYLKSELRFRGQRLSSLITSSDY
jgi:hypothetical protein